MGRCRLAFCLNEVARILLKPSGAVNYWLELAEKVETRRPFGV